MKSILNQFALTVLCAGAVILASGCASGGVKTGDTAADKLSSLAEHLERARGQVASTMTALNAMTKPDADLKKTYGDFKKEVASLQKLADDARARAEKMKAAVETHNTLWEQELQTMTNEDLKAQSAERRAAVMTQFGEIRTAFTQVSESFKPFNANLLDLVTYLGTDLSPSGISAASQTINSLKVQGVNVQRDITTATEKIRALRASMGR